MNIMCIYNLLGGTMKSKNKERKKRKKIFSWKVSTKKFQKQERKARKYMLFCINVGEGGSGQGGRHSKADKTSLVPAFGKNTVLQSQPPLLAFCIANL